MEPPVSPAGFIPRLESLRGLAAVSVVGYHAYDARHDTSVTGMAPVVLFFVLSGFVLGRSLDRDATALRFFRNRLFRLLPAAAVTVLLLTSLHACLGFYVGFEPSFDWLNVVLNALMIRSDINGVMWSMTVECLAAPLVFAGFLVWRRYGVRPLLGACAVLISISSWGPYVHLLGGFTNLAPLYAFIVGLLLQAAPRIEQRALVVLGSAMAALALLLVCGLRKQTALTILGETIASGALIWLIAQGGTSRLFAVLDTWPARLIGRISYSFYLLHPIGLSLAKMDETRSSLAIFLLGTLYTIPMAWLSWRFIERPFIALGKSFDAQGRSRLASFEGQQHVARDAAPHAIP